jgi:ribosomal protein S18 acetylase RimI-like enzyme
MELDMVADGTAGAAAEAQPATHGLALPSGPMGPGDVRAGGALDLRLGARLIVDAMNVVGSRPDGWWHDRDAAVARLAAALRRLGVGTGAEVVLVTEVPHPDADGGGRRCRQPLADPVRMTAATASGHRDADDAIVALVAEAPASDVPTVVVTADRELRDRVAGHGVEVRGPRWLWARLDATEAPAELTVAAAGPDRWRQARALRLAALADTPDAFASTLEEAAVDGADRWRDRLAGTDATTLLAEVVGPDGDQPVGVGMALVAPATEHPGGRGLYGVWVAPWVRGRGVGDALVSAAVGRAREAGACHLVLDVGDHNAPAAALYARHGFVATGARSALPPPRPHVTEHELALDLRRQGDAAR